jgi:hypothetical protein
MNNKEKYHLSKQAQAGTIGPVAAVGAGAGLYAGATPGGVLGAGLGLGAGGLYGALRKKKKDESRLAAIAKGLGVGTGVGAGAGLLAGGLGGAIAGGIALPPALSSAKKKVEEKVQEGLSNFFQNGFKFGGPPSEKSAYAYPKNPRLSYALKGMLGGSAVGGGLGYGLHSAGRMHDSVTGDATRTTVLGAGAGGLAGGLLGYLKGRAEEKELDEIEADMETNPEKYEYDTGNWLTSEGGNGESFKLQV